MGAVSFCTTTGVGIAAAETGATLEDGFTDEEEEEEDEEEEEAEEDEEEEEEEETCKD